jgi:hypothetical protein
VQQSKRRMGHEEFGTGGPAGQKVVTVDEPVLSDHLADQVLANPGVEGGPGVHGGAVGGDLAVILSDNIEYRMLPAASWR